MSFLSKILKREKDPGEQKEKAAEEKAADVGSVSFSGPISRVIIFPHVTEKTALLGKGNQYIFAVDRNANKIQVRRAVESQYGVKVDAVNIVAARGKERRRGKQIGWKPGFKKAVVTVKEGQSIEVQ